MIAADLFTGLLCLQQVLRGARAAVSENWTPLHGDRCSFCRFIMYPTSICIMCTEIVPRSKSSFLDVL
jgi:hypothetical protein